MIACSGGDDGAGSAATSGTGAPGPAAAEGTATTAAEAGADPTAAPADCAEERHGVVIDLGVVTYGVVELGRWVDDPGYDMRVRPGAVELIEAYRARGYEIVYLTGIREDATIGEPPVPIRTALEDWLVRHGFPTGDRTSLRMWDSSAFESATVFKTDTVVRLAVEGVTIDYGYTDDVNDVAALQSAGVPADHIFTIQAELATPGTVGVPESDWVSHRERVVDPLPPACAT